MTVDACNILEETVKNQTISDYSLACVKSYTNIINYYLESINCCDCYNKAPKCATPEPICNNTIISPACCNLCIYPNNDFPEADGVCSSTIFPNNTIINVKMISPNNEIQCQE